MLLIPLCLLGLLALDTVHTSPLTDVQLQHETLALDNVPHDAPPEVKLQNETLALDNVHTAASAEVKLQRGSCPMFWYSFNGRCYKYVASAYTWAEAELNCLSQDANLVSIRTVEEHNFIQDLIRNFDPEEGWTWIGMTDIHLKDNWMWSDGCRVDFTFWDAGQPNHGNERCVGTGYENTKWHDGICSATFSSVCASRTPCPY